MPPKENLTRERVIEAAAAVADRGGLHAVSMRNVGKEVGVEAMSLYHHVGNKDALLDELADWVMAQIALPRADEPWRTAMVRRADSARDVLTRHGWGIGLIESRPAPGHAVLRHHDSVIGCLLGNGFPLRLAAHLFSALDAYTYGFVITELNLPFSSVEGAEEAFVLEIADMMAPYPSLLRMMTEMVIGKDYAFADEFRYGLDLILDGFAARLERAR